MRPIYSFTTLTGSTYRVEELAQPGHPSNGVKSLWKLDPEAGTWHLQMHGIETSRRFRTGERAVFIGLCPGDDRPGYRITTSPVTDLQFVAHVEW